jgi:hypothetical protein
MSKIEPSKLAFNTDLLRYALITKIVSIKLSDHGFTNVTPAITCKYSVESLTITIKSIDRYAILKLKTELLDLEDILTDSLSKQNLINPTQLLKLKIVLG